MLNMYTNLYTRVIWAAFHLTLATLLKSSHLCLSNVKQRQTMNVRERCEHQMECTFGILLTIKISCMLTYIIILNTIYPHFSISLFFPCITLWLIFYLLCDKSFKYVDYEIKNFWRTSLFQLTHLKNLYKNKYKTDLIIYAIFFSSKSYKYYFHTNVILISMLYIMHFNKNETYKFTCIFITNK